MLCLKIDENMILAIVKFVVTENALWYFQLLLMAVNIH